MNKKEDLLQSEWIGIARKDWNRVYQMLQYDDYEACGLFLQQSLEKYPPLGHTYLTHEDIENGLIEARKFIRMMFPSEKFRVNE